MSELASIHNARYIGQADGEGAVIGQKKKIIKRMSVTKGINPYGPNIAKSIKQLRYRKQKECAKRDSNSCLGLAQ